MSHFCIKKCTMLIFSWAKSVHKPSFAISNKALTRRPVFAIKWLDYFEFETSVFLMQNVQKLNALKYATVFLSGGKKGGGGLNVR